MNSVYLPKLLIIILFGFLFFNSSCREDFETDFLNYDLRLSMDTVDLDTVFNFSISSTYELKIYNDGNDDVNIPSIRLAGAENSYYKINLNGQSGTQFADQLLRKNDSLTIFIRINAEDPQPVPYEDFILVEGTNNTQSILLTSFIEKANFITPPDGSNETVLSTVNWDSSMAQVIRGDLKITNALNISAGTRIYFAPDAQLILEDNATLNAMGTMEEPIIFRGARHENFYDYLPNQWKGIVIGENATVNMQNTTIRSGEIGLSLNQGTLATLENVQMINNEVIGLYALNASISATNLVSNFGSAASVALEGGGSYDFLHCTITNEYFGFNIGNNYALYLSNGATIDGTPLLAPLNQAHFRNCILYGNFGNGVLLEEDDAETFNYLFHSNVIKNRRTEDLNMMTTTGFTNIITDDPLFTSTEYDEINLRLSTGSPALGTANITFANEAIVDIEGVNRSANPNFGAFQKQPMP